MEQTNSRQNGVRFLYAAVGLVVLLFAGFVYGWSIFIISYVMRKKYIEIEKVL